MRNNFVCLLPEVFRMNRHAFPVSVVMNGKSYSTSLFVGLELFHEKHLYLLTDTCTYSGKWNCFMRNILFAGEWLLVAL